MQRFVETKVGTCEDEATCACWQNSFYRNKIFYEAWLTNLESDRFNGITYCISFWNWSQTVGIFIIEIFVL